MNTQFKLHELKLEVTYRCPLTCIHCSSDATPSSPLEMNQESCFCILKEAIDIGVKQIAFSGGEPLIWTAIEKAIDVASNGGIETTIYTSGNVPSVTRRIRKLADLNLRTCILSIFGATQIDHERITRKAGSYGRTLQAIFAAVDSGLRVELHFVPLSKNYFELESIANNALNWGVSRISVLRFVPQGRGSLISGRALNRIQNLQLKKAIEKLRAQGFDIRTGSPYNFLMLNKQPKCSSGIDRLIVGPNLRIYPCDAFKQIQAQELVGTIELSTLEGNTLSDCWNDSPFLNAVRSYLTTPFVEPCNTCSALDRCLSGCLAQKVIKYGDLEKRPDPMCLMAR